MQDLPQDPMDRTPRNSSAHLEAEALCATPTGRQSPKPCTASLSEGNLPGRQARISYFQISIFSGNFLTTGTYICLTLWGRQILCVWPGADSSEGKLPWDGQEWEESSLHHLLSMYWA